MKGSDIKYFGKFVFPVCGVLLLFVVADILGVSFTTELIKLVTATIGVVALIWGVDAIRKELQLRGVDAACGFLARLTASLKNLQRTAYTPGGSKESKEARHSVFISFCSEKEKKALRVGSPDACFAGDQKALADTDENSHWRLFEDCAQKILTLFDESCGQVPLSENMFYDFGDLYMVLQDMLTCKKHKVQMYRHKLHNYPENYERIAIGSEKMVNDERLAFDKLIEGIIDEANKRTKTLLGRLWSKLQADEENSGQEN
ncbi:MAG: hypothetical protein FWD25_05075 [Clostridia bacterium]|nr:hypothetical protein [Clostridia bacterium]